MSAFLCFWLVLLRTFLLPPCIIIVIWLSRGCYAVVARLLWVCHGVVARLLCGCCAVVTRLLWVSHAVMRLLCGCCGAVVIILLCSCHTRKLLHVTFFADYLLEYVTCKWRIRELTSVKLRMTLANQILWNIPLWSVIEGVRPHPQPSTHHNPSS